VHDEWAQRHQHNLNRRMTAEQHASGRDWVALKQVRRQPDRTSAAIDGSFGLGQHDVGGIAPIE
jgi:hypothetical protein